MMQTQPPPSEQETASSLDRFLDGIRHRPHAELAAALRLQSDRITTTWDRAVRVVMPQMDRLTYTELKDSVPAILDAIAATLESTDPGQISGLLERAPLQGLARFHQHYGIADTMQEDRLLRGLVVQHIEETLARQLTPPEAAALHAAIDVMLQQSVISLVNQQQQQLQSATEAQLKYLSFLSHDLNNNLNGVMLSLQLLRQQLGMAPHFADAVQTLDDAQQYIQDTMAGMRALLDHARLRKGAVARNKCPVDLHDLATLLVRQFSPGAERKQVRLVQEIPPGATLATNRELLTLVLQNLVGNAIKYSTGGTVRIFSEATRHRDQSRPSVAVADQGPGIAPDQVDRIFRAFERGEVHGEQGVGLGLAIASDAARLLDAYLTAESAVGRGSTFRVILPA